MERQTDLNLWRKDLNYRKRKKVFSKMRDEADLDLLSNPLNLNALLEYEWAVCCLRELKDGKRSKEKAKTA